MSKTKKVALAVLFGWLVGVGAFLVGEAFAARSTVGSRRLITYTVTGVAGDAGTLTLSAGDLAFVAGKNILKIKTTPAAGATAPSAYTIAIKDKVGGVTLHTSPARSATAAEVYDVFSAAGYLFALDQMSFVLTGMGEGKVVTIEILF
jgi:hypothetical protein